MAEEKFTPGPWRTYSTSISMNGENFNDYWQVRDDALSILCCTAYCGTANREANAHLIAAAPELYEALTETLEQCLGCFTEHYGENPEGASVPEYITKARAALAKARGETA